MRSQKQVRLFGKVRSLRNAAAAKRKIVRKHMEARKAWQHNSIRTGPQSHNELPVPQSSIRKVKEPKQRTAEEIAERRRVREQRRLEKYLNRRKRTARALGKTTKEKKEEKGQSNGMLKKVSAEQKTAPKRRTVGRMNKYWTPRIKLTTYAGQQNKQILVKKDVARKEKGELQQRNMKKAAEPVDDNLNQKTTPEVENKKVISRTLTISGSKIVETETPANMISKTDGKPPEKKGQTKPETEAKKITVQLHPASDSVQHQAATVQEHRCATKNTDKIISVVGSKVEMNAAKHEPPNKKELKQEVVKGNEQVKAEGSEQSQLNTDATADDLLKKHKKKRNRRPDGESRVSEKDHVVAYAHEMNEDEKSTDFTEVVGRRLKKKGHRDDQQNEKSVNEAIVNAHNEQRGKQHVSDTSQLLTSQESRVEKEQKRVEQAQANDRMDKVTAPSASDQINISKDTSHKSKKTEDVENRGDVPAKSENVPTTETKLEKLSPNKPTMNVPKLKEEHRKTLEAGKVGSGDSATEKIPSKTLIKEASDAKMDAEKKEPVVLASERQKEKSTQPVRERVHKLLPRDIQFCVRMIEKYGDDYEGMAKDEGNIHCDTAKGIARKIRIFRESPQYDAYLKQKAEKGASAAEK